MKKAETTDLEGALMQRTKEFRTFGCPEVTIGWYGRRRVDFMETNTKGVIRCYEIKISKADFHSKNGHNFAGHLNYYVMTSELYEQVKNEIPDHVGVLVGKDLISKKKAKRQILSKEDEESMKLYLLRSMSREVKKSFDSKDKAVLQYWKRRANRAEEKQKVEYREKNKLAAELTKIRRVNEH